MSDVSDYEKMGNGEIRLWIEQSESIMLHAASPSGDPVELTAEEARKIAGVLLKMAQEIEESSG